MLGIELNGWTHEEAEARVIETISTSLRSVFDIAKKERITTDAAARQLAHERLATKNEGPTDSPSTDQVGSNASEVNQPLYALPAMQVA